MRATLPSLAAAFALLSLLAPSRAHGGTGLPVSAKFAGFQRAAAAPAARATAHTLDVNSSGTRPGLHSAQMALMHGAPHTQATTPAQPERDSEPTQPNITHAARTHIRPVQFNPLAGHTQHAQALPGPAHLHVSIHVPIHVPIHASQSSHPREKPVTSSERKKSSLSGAETVLFGANQSKPFTTRSQPVTTRHNPSQPVHNPSHISLNLWSNPVTQQSPLLTRTPSLHT